MGRQYDRCCLMSACACLSLHASCSHPRVVVLVLVWWPRREPRVMLPFPCPFKMCCVGVVLGVVCWCWWCGSSGPVLWLAGAVVVPVVCVGGAGVLCPVLSLLRAVFGACFVCVCVCVVFLCFVCLCCVVCEHVCQCYHANVIVFDLYREYSSYYCVVLRVGT